MYNSTESNRSEAVCRTDCHGSYMFPEDLELESVHFLSVHDHQSLTPTMLSPERAAVSRMPNCPMQPLDFHLVGHDTTSDSLPPLVKPFTDNRCYSEDLENSKIDPFSFRCRIPVPWNDSTSAYQLWLMEASFMCRRNERERQRVRSVNDGFSRLRNHLPKGSKPRRQSKVETLRTAIDYIKQLQELLHDKESK